MSQNYTYTTSKDNQLEITTFGNSNLESGNCIIFVHGFKGFKDWGFGPYLASYFAERGNFVITFNFSHNGVGKNSIDFNELEKFANNTYSLEISEISEIVNAYKSEFFGKKNSEAKIGLIGHSRGGGDSIIAANLLEDIDALVTWAAVSKFDRFTERQKLEWKKNGYIEMMNARTKQMMRMNRVFLDDLENNLANLLNVEKALRNLKKPYLIVHGDQDLAVPILEADQIYEWSNKETTEIYKIYGTGHTFDIKHPFEESSKAFEKVLEQTNQFFIKHLRH